MDPNRGCWSVKYRRAIKSRMHRSDIVDRDPMIEVTVVTEISGVPIVAMMVTMMPKMCMMPMVPVEPALGAMGHCRAGGQRHSCHNHHCDQ